MTEESFLALMEVASAAVRLERPEVEVVRAHLAAWSVRPTRAEALFSLARYFRKRGEYANAYVYACAASTLPVPADTFGVEPSIYAWRALDLRASAAYRIGHFADALACNETLLSRSIPAEERERVVANVGACRAALERIRR